MMGDSRRFKAKGLVARNCELGDAKTRRRGLNNSFFRTIGVKSVDKTYRCLSDSRSAESAAARGSCGTEEVKA